MMMIVVMVVTVVIVMVVVVVVIGHYSSINVLLMTVFNCYQIGCNHGSMLTTMLPAVYNVSLHEQILVSKVNSFS